MTDRKQGKTSESGLTGLKMSESGLTGLNDEQDLQDLKMNTMTKITMQTNNPLILKSGKS